MCSEAYGQEFYQPAQGNELTVNDLNFIASVLLYCAVASLSPLPVLPWSSSTVPLHLFAQAPQESFLHPLLTYFHLFGRVCLPFNCLLPMEFLWNSIKPQFCFLWHLLQFCPRCYIISTLSSFICFFFGRFLFHRNQSPLHPAACIFTLSQEASFSVSSPYQVEPEEEPQEEEEPLSLPANGIIASSYFFFF